MHPLGHPAVGLGGARKKGTTVKTPATCLLLQIRSDAWTDQSIASMYATVLPQPYLDRGVTMQNQIRLASLHCVSVWVWGVSVRGSPIPNRSISEGSAHKSEPSTRRHPNYTSKRRLDRSQRTHMRGDTPPTWHTMVSGFQDKLGDCNISGHCNISGCRVFM